MDPKVNLSKLKNKVQHAGPGRQTLFRVTYRTQINLIRIADNKANMILGINAMIITVLIGIISSQVIFSSHRVIENLQLVMPIVLIMLTALFSTIYSIRAAQPRLITPKKEKDPTIKEKTSMLFFENIYHMKLGEYLEKMEILIDDSKAVHETMIIDIYNMSHVLHRKYGLLRISYIIFIFGFSCSIITFLIMWLSF
jgi:hypothetical protein